MSMGALIDRRNVGVTFVVTAVLSLCLHIFALLTALSSSLAAAIATIGVIGSITWIVGAWLLLRHDSKRPLLLAIVVLIGVQIASIVVYPKDAGGLLGFAAILLLFLGWAVVAR